MKVFRFSVLLSPSETEVVGFSLSSRVLVFVILRYLPLDSFNESPVSPPSPSSSVGPLGVTYVRPMLITV